MCTRYPIINRVSELKVHIELTRFVQPEKIEIDANERAVNEKSQYCFFVCTTFDSFLNDLTVISVSLHPTSPDKTNIHRLNNSTLFKLIISFQVHMLFSSHQHGLQLYLQHQFHRHRPCLSRKPFQNSLPSLADHCSFFKCTFIILSGSCNHINISE